MEAETVNAGTVYYEKHSTTSGRAHGETVCSVEIGARQRCTEGEKACGYSP